nr:methyltransferase domain-containing protein [Geotalea toluenoxydans]
MLRFFKNHGLRVLGIDPAKTIAEKATASGIETIPAFFTKELACLIREKHGRASIITANNVFAHADNMGDMADGIAALLDQDGIFCFEVSYLPHILENKLFDTIYHEHLCYHSIKPLQTFLQSHGLELIDFINIPTKGGSFRGIVQQAGGLRPVTPSVRRQIEYEKANAYDREETFEHFVSELDGIKQELTGLLEDLAAKGCTIAGYGASATVTTLIYYLGLGKFLQYLVDDNPRKQGTFSRGCICRFCPQRRCMR